MFDEDKPFVYVIGTKLSYTYDGDFFDWLYLPMRWLPVLRQGDWAVLPDIWAMKNYVRFLEQTLWDFVPNILWVPVSHYLLDEAIANSPEVVNRLCELAQDGYVFVPYDATTREFRLWFDQIPNAVVLGEDALWGTKYATKSWLHPWANAPDEASIAQRIGLPVLPGYNACSNQELIQAYRLLRDGGVRNFGIKPIGSAFGDGIIVLGGSNGDVQKEVLGNYAFPHGPVILEQWVDIDHDDLGERSWSTHYCGKQLFGPPTRQIVRHRTSAGNITPGINGSLGAQMLQHTQSIVTEIQPQGMGGINGPIVDGKAYVTDLNTGRITGVCCSLAFQSLYCPELVTVNRKLGKPKMSIFDAWNALGNMRFNPASGRGVMIQGWIDSAWSQIIVCDPSEHGALDLLHHAEEVLGMAK